MHAKSVTILSVIFGALLLSVDAGAAKSESSGPGQMSSECISKTAHDNIAACPGGPAKFDAKKQRGAAFKSMPPPPKKKDRQDAAKPQDAANLSKFAERDTRKTRLQARARALLITEIQGLERLFKRTPKKSGDRPQLVRRLAEAYVELESAAVRDKIASDIKAQDAKRKKKGNAAQHRSEATKAKKIEEAARMKAIAYYKLMKTEYPNYSKTDEVLYYLAYEYEQAGDLANARKTYYELIEKAPKSEYIPNAYLAFGELFFQEAQGDPSKWDLAGAAYREVVKYPAPKNKVYGYARYKLAYVHWNKGEYAEALNEFKKVIEYGTTHGNLPNAKQLAKSARRDLIPVYAISGAPNKAYNFFKPLSGDTGGSDDKTIDMLNELGFAYLDTGHYPEGIQLYKDLMGRDQGKRYCHYQSQVSAAVQAAYSGDKERIKGELDNQVRIYKEFGEGKSPNKEKLECANKTAELLAETAMSWHLEAVGSGGVRGTGDGKTMDLAAYLYKKVTETFTNADFAKFEFPRIVKEDWPTLPKIRYAMADLLYFRKRWEECGPAFDAVVAEDPKGPNAAEAAYASVLCYQKMYDQMYKGESDRQGKGLGPRGAGEDDRKAQKGEWEKFKPKEMNEQQKGMVQAFNRYVCYIKPPKGDAEAEEQYVEVKYGRARIYFEAQHWEEAALGFRDIALNHPDKDAGIFAAQLYLEAVNVLGAKAEPPRPSCFDDMGKDVPLFLENYCKGSKFEDNKDQCELLTRIKFDIQRLGAQKKVELADSQAEKGNYSAALDNYKDGADSYLEIWRTYCEGPLANKEKPKQCEQADQIVYNMAKAYQAARLLAKSIQARKILLTDKYGLHETELAKKAIYEIGGNYQAIAVYDQAAFYYEMYADKTAYKGEFADKALADAVVLRLGLGMEDEAIKDADAFKRYYGARKPEETAQIAFAIADHYGEKKDWQNVTKNLGGAMGLIDKKATLDVRLQAHALLARAYQETNRGATAKTEYKKVVGLWSDPAKGVAEIQGIKGENEAGTTRRLGRALEAVGEALFYFAEQEKKKVDDYEFPAYKGQKDKEGITKHIGTKVKDWYVKKKGMIEGVSAEYKKIVDLQPVPPPRWVIAAGSRVGDMWGKFVDDFRSAPIPKAWESDYEIRTAYYGALDDASEPFKGQARGAYEICLGYSVKYQYFDQFSRTCEEWLADKYKSEFHLIDEFRGSPIHINDPLKEESYPLRLGGEPLIPDPKAAPPPKKEEKAAQ
ncbi:MAG TPA: tetratricopeptide repeat protein [Polyangiaceae bacterium]